jgi:hypothetical protein
MRRTFLDDLIARPVRAAPRSRLGRLHIQFPRAGDQARQGFPYGRPVGRP